MGYLLAIVVGAVIGAVFSASGEGSFAALAGAAIGWLGFRSLRQQTEIAELRRGAGVESAPGQLPPPAVSGEPGDATPPSLEPPSPTAPAAPIAPTAPIAPAAIAFTADDKPIAAAGTSVAASFEPVFESAGSPAAATLPRTDGLEADAGAGAAAPPQRPAFWEPVRRWLVGGNTIVKAGVAILFVGLAFLAKYAAEHSQLSPEWRLAAVGAAAIALLAVGWRLRLKRAGYAQVLQGGAIAVLYLTLFAAFRYYGVISALPAFLLMVVVAGLAAALAVLQDARALAVVGALGGFATPLIVSTGSDNAVALFSYYLVLDAGIAAVAWFKTWRLLNLVGFFATFVVATGWGVLRYSPADFAVSEAFLLAFFLLFIAIMVMPARHAAAAGPADANQPLEGPDAAPVGRSHTWVNSSLLFGLPTIVFALQYGLVQDTPFGAALSALVLAGVYVVLASWMKSRPALGITFDASLAIAIVFLTLVIPFALDERSIAGAWTLEGAGLVWIGFRQSRGLPRVFGYGLLLVAGFAMLLGHERLGAPQDIFNAYLFNGLMAAAASIAAAFFVHRHGSVSGAAAEPASASEAGTASASASASAPEPAAASASTSAPGPATSSASTSTSASPLASLWAGLRSAEMAMQPLLIGLATLWLLTTVAVQIDNFVAFDLTLAVTVASVSAIALLFVVLGARLDWRAITWPASWHAPVLLLAALVDAAIADQPWRHGGWWAWPIAFAVHAAVLRAAAPRWPDSIARPVHAIGLLALALVGASLGRGVTDGWGDTGSAWPWLGWLVVPALFLLWLPRPATARLWPVRDQPSAYRGVAAGVLAVILGLWTLVANLASDGTAAPLPHVPVLNPLDLGVALVLVAIVAWLRSLGEAKGWRLGLLCAAGFVWLNAILLRGFFHYGGVPYDIDAWLDSLAVQTGLTLLWTAIALVAMWWAAQRAMRAPWVVGAALLGAVVLKLLVVDLSGTGTVMRIVSFIGVGVLMLVIGYVAPLPAKDTRHAAV